LQSSARAGRRPRTRIALALLCALAALGIWLGRGLLPLPPRLAGGEHGIARDLARQESARLSADGLALELRPLRFAEVSAAVEGARATVVAVLDAEGAASFAGQSAAVSYIGRERFHMRTCGAGWCAEADQLARLRGVLAALLRRHLALAAAAPGRRVLAWQVRVERELAEAGEDWEIPGPGGASRRGRDRLSLRWEGDRWALQP
jgi:hypothetical protein